MQKDVLPYPLALRMKRLGFNEMCAYWYNKDFHEDPELNHNKNQETWLSGDHCSAPTPAQCLKWFRDNYQIQGVIASGTVKRRLEDARYCDYVYEIRQIGESTICSDRRDEGRGTYEEAELECLVKIIEIVESIQASIRKGLNNEL